MSPDNNPSANSSIHELLEKFSNGSPRQRRSLVDSVELRAAEIAEIGEVALESFDPNGDDWAAGWILQVVKQHQPDLQLHRKYSTLMAPSLCRPYTNLHRIQ